MLAATIAYMLDQALTHAAAAEPAAMNEMSGELHWVTLVTADRDATVTRVACLTAADVDTIAALRAPRQSLDQMVLELLAIRYGLTPVAAPQSWTRAYRRGERHGGVGQRLA
jgi:hypothetical protein